MTVDQAVRVVDAIDDVDHIHDDDCRECAREGCGHLNCEHDEGDRDCDAPGCDCRRCLSVSDCPTCDGDGLLPGLDVEDERGCAIDTEVRCRDCAGSGLR